MKKWLSISGFNRHDLIFVIAVIAASALVWTSFLTADSAKASGKTAVVTYRDEEILRIDLSVEAVYEVEAALGTVTIEVRDGKVRVEKETSPYHCCSLQGFTDRVSEPIICLPNELMVRIEGVSDPDGNDVNLR